MFAVGMTGSGKSYAAKRVQRHFPRRLICDAKGDWGREPGEQLVQAARDLGRAKRPVIRVCLPSCDVDEWDQVCWWAWRQGNLCIVIDDLNLMLKNGRMGPGLKACVTTGRGRGVTMIICTQRPAGVPVEVRSEANLYLMFSLQHPDDRDYMSKVMGEEVMTNPRGHSFWFFRRPEMDRPTYHVLTKG